MKEAEFYLLLQRYLDGRCTPQEQALVERWYQQLEKAEGASLRSQNQEAVEDAIWQRITQARANAAPAEQVLPHPATSSWQKAPLWWAAALLVFALGLGALLPTARQLLDPVLSSGVTVENGWTRRTNTTQQVQEFQLPDGSGITLHPGSSLRYANGLVGPRREVHLEGEAFFKVSKNPSRPFLVFTQQILTTVLGTSFRVKAYAGGKQATVDVREGKVAVQDRSSAKLEATPTALAASAVLLLPNQQVVYSAAKRQLKKGLVDKPVLLAPQAFAFEERPVTEVLTALEKAYGVSILYDRAKLANCTVSITFYEEPLFEKLGLLCKTLGTYYSITDERIVFHSAGCQL